jgi:hypothetical protein
MHGMLSGDCLQIRSLGGLHGSRLPHRAAGVASNHFEYEIGSQLPHRRAAGATSNHFEYEIGSRLLHHAIGAAKNHFEYEIGSPLPPQAMPLELPRQITNNFSERLGRGTFGTVYKASKPRVLFNQYKILIFTTNTFTCWGQVWD